MGYKQIVICPEKSIQDGELLQNYSELGCRKLQSNVVPPVAMKIRKLWSSSESWAHKANKTNSQKRQETAFGRAWEEEMATMQIAKKKSATSVMDS